MYIKLSRPLYAENEGKIYFLLEHVQLEGNAITTINTHIQFKPAAH